METDFPKVDGTKSQSIGPLAKMLGQFPILFARAVIFGTRRSQMADSSINNGTCTLVNLGMGPIAVTCSHVLAGYRRLRESDENLYFQVGNVTVNVEEQLIDESVEMDLATIRLTGKQAEILQNDGIPGASIFQPVMWPSSAAKVGDSVTLGGFPKGRREKVAFDELRFNSYSIGATVVSSVGEDRFACQFQRDRWVSFSQQDSLGDEQSIGGLSGGPAFVLRELHYELVGIISEFSRNYDILFLKPACLIAADGTIGV